MVARYGQGFGINRFSMICVVRMVEKYVDWVGPSCTENNQGVGIGGCPC